MLTEDLKIKGIHFLIIMWQLGFPIWDYLIGTIIKIQTKYVGGTLIKCTQKGKRVVTIIWYRIKILP